MPTERRKSAAHRSQPPRIRLRGRVWIELAGKPALTESGADLLEQIEACGSLSEAARRLRFSYRRAWMLLDAMNTRWPRPLARTATGGKRGGGSRLTDAGHQALRTYRDLQIQIEALLDHARRDFVRAARP